MATRILKHSELVQLQPYLHQGLKQTLCGKQLLLYLENNELCCKLIKSEEAWRMDTALLVQCGDCSDVQKLNVILDNGAVWVVLPDTAAEKAKAAAGYGLGASFTLQLPSADTIIQHRPSVPEPWMGSFADNQPVIPREGLEWARAQKAQCVMQQGLQRPQQPKNTRTQQTINSMFAPLKVEPMDF